MRESSVSVRSLRKVYKPSPAWMKVLVRSNLTNDVVALEDVSFEVGPGETLAVVGPNGAGKSTVFRILVGLTTPTLGSAHVMGLDCARKSKAVRRLVGWMPAEDRSLLLRLTCRENLRFHGRLHGMTKPQIVERTDRVLHDVGLTAYIDATPFALSAGMKARLQLARALLHEPRILVLDEPTGSVDPVAAHSLLELIIELVETRKLAALISSHRLEEIEALHSQVILLDEGAIRYNGDLDDLRKEYDRARIEFEFDRPGKAAAAAARLRGSNHIESVVCEDSIVTVALRPNARIANVVKNLGEDAAALIHIRDTRTPLRDILASMYSRSSSRSETAEAG